MEFIIAIATLCQFSIADGTHSYVTNQGAILGCQKWYIQCWEDKQHDKKYKVGNAILVDCIKEKK